MKRYYPGAGNVTAGRRAVIAQANEIIAEYQQQGFELTLRQLYYQFVARGMIPNRQQEYKRLGDIVQLGRMAGQIDWYAIVDRTRFERGNSHWDSPAEIIRASARQFRYDLWEDQPERVAVWIEKDALVGVIEGVCRRWDVPYFSCRGYVSSSEMWSAAQRYGRWLAAGQKVTILHLGDHDPSGVDMTNDIRRRLLDFTVGDIYHNAREAGMSVVDADDYLARRFKEETAEIQVKRIALTMDQIEEFNPPPNPAKLSDSRARAYVEAYGSESWELDALDPATLDALIEEEVSAIVDPGVFELSQGRQEAARVRLEQVADDFEESER